MPILAFFVAIFFLVPLISANLARRLGRSFGVWFALGCVLPFVSVFILLLLPDRRMVNNS